MALPSVVRAPRWFTVALTLLAAGARASCPAGTGLPTSSSTECVACGAGTWSDEGMAECQRCPPGTWSDERGASSEGACRKCPQGTWSSQEGSPTMDSCRSCPAGRWGARPGLADHLECSACPAGTWSDRQGATSQEVCVACVPGKWSPVSGADAASTCIDCSPGTWSDVAGASSQSSCKMCPAGTWNSKRGAATENSCSACRAGTYQPALGQANESVCIRCEPGKYSAGVGATSCMSCPHGTWSSGFEAASCNACPSGTSSSLGSVRASDCKSCTESPELCRVAEMHITIQVKGLAWSELSTSTEEALSTAFAHNIASACGVSDSSVVDVYGSNASVTVNSNGELSVFVLAETGYTAAELQSKLSSTLFQEAIVDSAAAILASGPGMVAGHVTLGTVVVESEHFAPLPSTSRASTGGTEAASTSMQTTTGITTNISAVDVVGHAAASDGATEQQAVLGMPPWVWFVIASILFAGLFLCVHRVYLTCTRRQSKAASDEETGAQPPATQSTSQYGLPVLLGGEAVQGTGGKDGLEAASTASGDPTQGSLRAPDFLRTSLDNVEEGGLWNDSERPVHDGTRTDYDCTKGCNVSCW